MCAASTGSVVQAVPAQARGLTASFAATAANVPQPTQKYRHPRAIRDGQ